jgi:hypothetical protein
MHVTNREPCTLIIGDTQIAFGKTEPIDPAWEKRCEEMADRGALTLHRGGKPDDRPSRGMTPAELFAAMSPAEQRAAIAQVRAGEQVKPEPELVRAVEHFAETFSPVVSGVTGPTEDTQPDVKAPTGAPSDFATCHVNKALAFVRKCTDVAVLTSLGNDENRESVLNAIIERIQVLEPKAN